MVSVVVCTYNRSDVLRRMLQSFFEQDGLDRVDHELIIVDNNSTDDTRSVVEPFLSYPGFRYVFEKRQGVSNARNRGIAESRGNIVTFLDDDVVLGRSWAVNLKKAFEETGADVVGGRTYLIFEQEPPPWLQHEFRVFLSEVNLGEKRLFLDHGDALFSVNLAIRKSALDRAGGFDGMLGPNGSLVVGRGEDTALVRSLASVGARIMYEPTVIVGHLVGPERLTWDYFARHAAGTGKALALLEDRSSTLWQLLRAGNALSAWIKSIVNYWRTQHHRATPYEKKFANWTVRERKAFFITRLKRAFEPV